MGQDAFEYHNGAVDNNTEVYRPQAHQIGRDIEQPHHDKSKQHGQRNDRSNDKPCTHIAQKYNQYLQPIITQYFIDNKSEIWLLFLIAHSKRWRFNAFIDY